MTDRNVAALACRILSVYAFLKALGALQLIGLDVMSLASPAGQDAHSRSLVIGQLLSSSLFPTILFTTAGLFLWIKADWLSRRMMAGTALEQETRWGGGGLQTTAVAIVGLVVLAQAVPHLCDALGSLWLQARAAEATDTTVPDHTGRVIVQWASLAVQVGLGLRLLLGANGISDFLQRRRVAEAAREGAAAL